MDLSTNLLSLLPLPNNMVFNMYKASPLHNGYSSSQLLMGRKLRTILPVHSKLLDPQLPDKETVRINEENQKRSQEEAYNQRHRVRPLKPLQEGDKVWIADSKS